MSVEIDENETKVNIVWDELFPTGIFNVVEPYMF